MVNDHSNAQKKENNPENSTPSVAILPTADWDAELRLKSDPARNRRNSDYDIKDKNINPADFALNDQSPPEVTIFPSTHELPQPAFPVVSSDAIVIGNVTSAEAHLSNDRTHIYSEYGVSIIKIFKGDLLSGNSAITVERAGGRVKLPSGKILSRYGVDGKNYPAINAVYMFFLQQDTQSDNYRIITGYEIKKDQVFPLDRSPNPKTPLRYLENFDKYYGVTKRDFWSDLNRELRLQGVVKPRKAQNGVAKK